MTVDLTATLLVRSVTYSCDIASSLFSFISDVGPVSEIDILLPT